MIKLIIWSKDRACQLDFLLRSIDKYAPDWFDVTVIFTASNGFFRQGYQKLLDNRAGKSIMVLEKNFREDTLEAISSANKWVCFGTDDDVFYKSPLSLEETTPYLPKFPGEVFSLRLGLNTVLQNYKINEYQAPLIHYINTQNVISWNAQNYIPIHNYGYPMSVNFHIFRKEQIYELAKMTHWKNPNNLEGSLFNYRSCCPYMSAFKHSCVLNIPVNCMSGMTPTNNSVSLEELNDNFLKGRSLSFDSLNNVKVIGCHQEIPLIYE